MLATVGAADSAKVQKKSTAFLYIAKRNHMLRINRRIHCVFYSILSISESNYFLSLNINILVRIKADLKAQLYD